MEKCLAAKVAKVFAPLNGAEAEACGLNAAAHAVLGGKARLVPPPTMAHFSVCFNGESRGIGGKGGGSIPQIDLISAGDSGSNGCACGDGDTAGGDFFLRGDSGTGEEYPDDTSAKAAVARIHWKALNKPTRRAAVMIRFTYNIP